MSLLCLAVFLAAGLLGPAAFGQVFDNPDPDYEIVPWGKGHIVKGEVLVQFKKGQAMKARAGLHEKFGTEFVETVDTGLELVRFKEGDIDDILEKYNNDQSVDFAEPNIVFFRTKTTPNDTYFGQMWGMKKIESEYAWDIFQGNPLHLCAMIDTGLDMNHTDFNGQYAGGYDYYSNDNNPDDKDGHGTHTAGTVAAKTNNNKGVAGVAWNCRLLIYRVGNYTFPTSAVVNSINAARTAGALTINMSFGSYQASSSIKNALTNAVNAGMVCVASAGNDSTTQKHYPSAYNIVIGVASSNKSDGRSSFSNYSSTWCEVAAPGQDILSTYDGNQYAWADGTSMSAPHVTGMATILYSKLGGVRNQANGTKVRNAIQDTCIPKSWVKYGRVDLFAAMNQLAPPAKPTLTSVTPQNVKAFNGGTMTLKGTNFISVSKVTVAGIAITGSDITVVNSTEIKVQAPTAPGGLGAHNVTVTNSAGTSNPVSFNYIETSPPALQTPMSASAGETFTWEFGAASNDIYLLVISDKGATVPFKGFNILQTYYVILSANLNAAGVGSQSFTVPSGLGTVWMYSQIFTFDEAGSHPFTGASNVAWSILIM
jgi:thermitase